MRREGHRLFHSLPLPPCTRLLAFWAITQSGQSLSHSLFTARNRGGKRRRSRTRRGRDMRDRGFWAQIDLGQNGQEKKEPSWTFLLKGMFRLGTSEPLTVETLSQRHQAEIRFREGVQSWQNRIGSEGFDERQDRSLWSQKLRRK